LWSANALSNLGDGLYQTALPLLAASLSSQPLLLAGLTITLSLPWLVFALQAGSLVDRLDRRSVMLSVNLGRIAILLLLTIGVLTGSLTIFWVYLAAFLLGVGETLMDTALTSIIPAVVQKDKLAWANARISAAQTTTNSFIGPPLAGFLVGLGLAWASGASLALYVLAGAALLLMRGRFRAAAVDAPGEPFWPRVTAGLRFLWGQPLLRRLTIYTASMNLFWSGWATLLVLFAVAPGPMGRDGVAYGLLLTAMAAGGLLGSMLTERLLAAAGRRLALSLDFIGTVLLVGVPAISTNFVLMALASFVAGFGASVWVVINASLRQQLAPEQLLGRVYSASRFVSWGIGPLGAALAGFVAQTWGLRSWFGFAGLASLGLLAFFFATMPKDEDSHVSP
jgi:MFS family permease